MRTGKRSMIAVASALMAFASTSMWGLAATAPGLGTATTFAVLAGQTVTNTGTTTITGDLGVSPGTAVTGAPTVVGTTHTGSDPVAVSAKNDLATAYGNAASSACNFDETGKNLGGQTLSPGTYCQTTAPTLTGTLVLSGDGVFIFKAGSTLVTAPGATVSLINGAQACNVYWQVGSSATLDTTTTFVGTIMALTDINLKNGATIAGRALARNGQVTLISNKITRPSTCNAAATAGGPTPAPPTSQTTQVPQVPQIPHAGAVPAGNGGALVTMAAVAFVLTGCGVVVLRFRAVRRRHQRA